MDHEETKTLFAPEVTTKENHDLLMDFLNQTTDHHDPLNGYIKATLCQFLLNVRQSLLHFQTDSNKKSIPRKTLITIQIEELQQCIDDLKYCLNKQPD